MRYLFRFFILFYAIVASHTTAHAFDTLAQQAYLLDHRTGQPLFNKEGNVPMTPSSMTKLMTIYLVFERLQNDVLKMDDTFVVSEKAWKKGGSRMFVKHRDQVTISDLLRGIIVQSGNDACIVVAENIATSEENFADLMNEKAKELGLTETHFENSTGWPDEGHQMSAKDIALLSKRLIQDFPEYYPLFKEQEFTYNNITQPNRNTLLSRDPTIDGLKTGHTQDGGYGIVVSALRDNRRLIAVVNGLSSSAERINEAQRLLNYGYRYFKDITLGSENHKVADADVWLGKQKTVSLVMHESIDLAVPKLDEENIKAEVHYQSPIPAPINAGDKLAELHVNIPNREPISIPLYAGESITEAGFGEKFMAYIKQSIQ